MAALPTIPTADVADALVDIEDLRDASVLTDDTVRCTECLTEVHVEEVVEGTCGSATCLRAVAAYEYYERLGAKV